jgi:transcriptional regulator with XRE-family HTH domain
MAKYKRAELAAEATRLNLEQLARLGGELRRGRIAQRLRQKDVAIVAGLGRSTVSEIERGRGGGHTLDSWQRLALAVGRPLRVELARNRTGVVADAGHLDLQELVLRLGNASGWRGAFELPIRPTAGRHSVDVGLRHDGHRILACIECWNTFDDIGAAVRSSMWKWNKAEEVAIAVGHGRQYAVTGCWVVRATAHNRAIVERYPEVFASKFPGSSLAWARSIVAGASPPHDIGLIWADVKATRLFAWRQAVRTRISD